MKGKEKIKGTRENKKEIIMPAQNDKTKSKTLKTKTNRNESKRKKKMNIKPKPSLSNIRNMKIKQNRRKAWEYPTNRN